MKCEVSIAPEIFSRFGVYYVRVNSAGDGEAIDVALHGISSREEAHAAAAVVLGAPETGGCKCTDEERIKNVCP
jgi:hypothetical protein